MVVKIERLGSCSVEKGSLMFRQHKQRLSSKGQSVRVFLMADIHSPTTKLDALVKLLSIVLQSIDISSEKIKVNQRV